MTLRPLSLSIALALAAAGFLPGCDSSANLTEQEHIQRAKDFEDQGKLNVSIIELKNAIQKNPDSPQARLLLGQVYLKTGQGAAAEKELTRAEKLGVSRETLKPLLGDALLMMGEYKRVLDEIHPGDQTSRVNLARITQIRADAMMRQGQIKESCALFQQALDTDKTHVPTYWGLANCAVAERDMPKARAWLDDALKLGTEVARTWIGIGNLEQYNKNQPGALAAFTSALKVEPDNQEALQNRAALNLGLGHLDAAQADVDRINRLAPRTVAAHYLKGLLNFERKKYAEARSALDDVFKLTPDHMPSVLLAGATAHELGAYQQAESLLNRFLGRYPHHAYARRVLASTQIRQNQADRALETLAPLIAPEKRDAAALVLASEAWRLKGDVDRTAAYLERAASIAPTNAYIQAQLGISHLSTGERQLAIGELGKAAAVNSGDYRADFALIMTHLERKEFDQALRAIDVLDKKRPDSALTQTMRGSALVGKGDLAGARKSFEKALSVDPAFFPAAASLAELDVREKQPAAARARFERLLSHDRNNLEAMTALANLATVEKREQDALRWLRKAIESHPQAIAPRATLVRYHLARKEGQKALAVATEAVNVNPDNPAALDLLGSVQRALNDTAGAVSTYSKLAQKAGQSPDAQLQLALAQIAARKVGDARTTLQRSLALNPHHLASLDALIKLETNANQSAKALTLARQIQTQAPKSALGFEREGDIHLHQKRGGEAAQAYVQALARSDSPAIAIKLHRAQTLATGAAPADAQLDTWIKRHPKDNAARIYAAENDRANGRFAAAIARYQGILQTTPAHPVALNNLASLYHRQGDARALPTAQQALKVAPDSAAILDTVGWILVEKGEARRGLDYLQRALAQEPDIAGIRYHHAVALARTGNPAKARAELERLLRQTPRFPEADAARQALDRL